MTTKKAIKRFYESDKEAIKVAKSRAKSNYRTHYIYQNEGRYLVREILYESEKPIMKVLYDGTVQHLTQEQPTQ